MNIITVTLNPGYDVFYTIEDFTPFGENYVSAVRTDAGGKGINISRALAYTGVKSTAAIILGKSNSPDFEDLIGDCLPDRIIHYVNGRIRANTTICSAGGRETRISLDNFSITGDDLRALEAGIAEKIGSDTVVAFAGRLPRGITHDDALCFLDRIRGVGAKLAVDCNSLSIEELKQIRPWLIKPNEVELASLTGIKATAPEDAVGFARELNLAGIENVLVTLGSAGAAFAGGGLVLTAEVPHIIPVSTVGAGDCTVAGFISAYARGLGVADCLREALAFGSASCLTAGTGVPLRSDIDLIRGKIKICTAV